LSRFEFVKCVREHFTLRHNRAFLTRASKDQGRLVPANPHSSRDHLVEYPVTGQRVGKLIAVEVAADRVNRLQVQSFNADKLLFHRTQPTAVNRFENPNLIADIREHGTDCDFVRSLRGRGHT
jgi:hypothetical protein